MELTIVSSKKIITEQVDWVEVITDVGSFVIQQGHIPTLLVFAPDKEFSYKPVNKDEQHLTIRKGVLSVNRKSATALVHI